MSKIRDGDLYRTIRLNGKEIEIRYGFYEEFERGHHDPVPIYPNLKTEPIYDEDGAPYVTAMQDVCSRFEGGDPELGCYSCKHYKEREELIGVCLIGNKEE